MKKQCTSSHCRHIFDTDLLVDKKCPFCGKEYPRMNIEDKHTKRGSIHYTLTIEAYSQSNPLFAACVVRSVTGWDLSAARNVLGRLPATLAEELTRDSASIKKNMLEKAGCTVRLVPHRNSNKH